MTLDNTAKCWICGSEESVSLFEFGDCSSIDKVEDAGINQLLICDACATDLSENTQVKLFKLEAKH